MHENEEKAKLTNVLSYEPYLLDCEFLIDEDVKMVLENFNIAEHYLYEARVCFKDQALKYWMFHIPHFEYDVIDFKRSVFYSGPRTRKEYAQVNDLNEYQSVRNQKQGSLMPVRLALNEKFDKTLDLFSLRIGGVFVSERLRDELLKCVFTGVDFTPAFADLPDVITLIQE